MNYDAVGISAYDLAAGLQFFRKIVSRSEILKIVKETKRQVNAADMVGPIMLWRNKAAV